MKDIGDIINNLYQILEQKKYKNEKLYYFNQELTKKIIKTINSEKYINSGFDYKTCENILNFMIGQFGYFEERMEEPSFAKQNLQYWADIEKSITFMLENMSFEHDYKLADRDYINNINKKLLSTRFDRDLLNNFNKRYGEYSFNYVNECLCCNKM